MEIRVHTFNERKGLEDLADFINEMGIKPEHIQLIIREGTGYKLLFWTKKVKSQ